MCRLLSLLQYLRSQLEVTVDATLRRLPAPQLDTAAPIPDPSPTHLAPPATAVFTSAHMHIPTQPHSGNLGTAATLRPNRPLWEQRGEGEGEGQVGGRGGAAARCVSVIQ